MKIPGRKKSAAEKIDAGSIAESPKAEKSVAIAVRVEEPKETAVPDVREAAEKPGASESETARRFRIGIDCRMYGARFTGI